jgi:hypothetical protein
MRDEYWMIILVNSLLSLLRYGWWLTATKRRPLKVVSQN